MLSIFSLVKPKFKILFSDVGGLIALFRRKKRRFVLMGGHGVGQGLELPLENSCFDFLVAFSILLEWK